MMTFGHAGLLGKKRTKNFLTAVKGDKKIARTSQGIGRKTPAKKIVFLGFF